MRSFESTSVSTKVASVAVTYVIIAGVAALCFDSFPEGIPVTLHVHDSLFKTSTLSYTSHAPIRIDGDSQFTSENGVASGNGTPSNPYIIEGWSIEVSAQSEISEIEVDNASVHFVIRDCQLVANDSTGGSSLNYGISLYDCINGLVEDNSCSHNGDAGIALSMSKNCVISNNNCSIGHGPEVRLYSSSNITVDNNSFWQAGWGIWLESGSNNNRLLSNNCSGLFRYGITIESSSNVVSLNELWENDDYGIYLREGSRGNVVWNNTLIGNFGFGSQANDDGKGNSWNSLNGYGNYWSNWTGPDNVAPFGRVDSPYKIAGSAGAKDYYSLVAPHISDGPYTPMSKPMQVPVLGLYLVIVAAIAVIIVSFVLLKRYGQSNRKPPTF
jgi:parallel beta-helix repeat protein